MLPVAENTRVPCPEEEAAGVVLFAGLFEVEWTRRAQEGYRALPYEFFAVLQAQRFIFTLRCSSSKIVQEPVNIQDEKGQQTGRLAWRQCPAWAMRAPYLEN